MKGPDGMEWDEVGQDGREGDWTRWRGPGQKEPGNTGDREGHWEGQVQHKGASNAVSSSTGCSCSIAAVLGSAHMDRHSRTLLSLAHQCLNSDRIHLSVQCKSTNCHLVDLLCALSDTMLDMVRSLNEQRDRFVFLISTSRPGLL